MIFSILSAILFLLMIFFPHEAILTPALLPHMALMMGICGTTMLIIVPLMTSFFFSPFQKIEQNLAPKVIDSIIQDKFLAWGNILLFFFPFLSYTLICALIFSDIISKTYILGLWILFLGFTIDILRAVIKRSLSYLDPSMIIDHFVNNAKNAILNNQDSDMLLWIDAISDISMKAIERHTSTLLTQSLNAISRVLQSFLEACNSIPHQDKELESSGVDEIGYTIFYIVNRIEMIYNKALTSRTETFCSQAISTLGKITISAAKLDISLATLPIQIIGKLASKAQEQNLDDVAIKASGVLLEIAKSILPNINIAYTEIKDPFIAINRSLENIAKATFRKDKTLSIGIIIEPLKSFQAIMQNEKYAAFTDTPTILSDISRVLDEFAILEQVLRTIPTIPKMEEEKPLA